MNIQKWASRCEKIRKQNNVVEILDYISPLEIVNFLLPVPIYNKTIYSPTKSCLLEKIYGKDWYELIYPYHILHIDASTYYEILTNKKIRQIYKENILFVFQYFAQEIKESYLWNYILQVCYDFNFQSLYQEIMTFIKKSPLWSNIWSKEEKALIYLIW